MSRGDPCSALEHGHDGSFAVVDGHGREHVVATRFIQYARSTSIGLMLPPVTSPAQSMSISWSMPPIASAASRIVTHSSWALVKTQ